MNYPDDELVYYLNDKNEIAQDEIYNKHKNIIDIYLNKYRRVFYALNIDLEEARQEANLGFSYAIYNYDEEKEATLSTFINLCVDRRLRKLIRSYETMKNKIISETVSLNNTNSDFNLEDIIGDEKYEPLRKLEGIDTLKYINSEVKKLNFYTSCAFEGCDIYDKNGLCIIICDTNIATTILDISTKIRQICGRLRDSKYKDECVIILNSSKHRYANTPVQKFIQKVNESEQLGKVKEESLQHCSPIQMAAELKLYNKETYSNLYLNKFKDKIFYDVNLKKLDIYNYHLISEIYIVILFQLFQN